MVDVAGEMADEVGGAIGGDVLSDVDARQAGAAVTEQGLGERGLTALFGVPALAADDAFAHHGFAHFERDQVGACQARADSMSQGRASRSASASWMMRSMAASRAGRLKQRRMLDMAVLRSG